MGQHLTQRHTTLDCCVATRQFEVTCADMCFVARNAVPTCIATLDTRSAQDGPFIAVKNTSLASRSLHSRCSSLEEDVVSRVRMQEYLTWNQRVYSIVYLFQVVALSS